MPNLEPPGGTIEAPYVAGDPWTSDDASSLARPSLAFYDAAILEHDDDGPHKVPTIARAAALVTWSGGAYSVTKGYSVTTGAGSVTRLSAGLVKVDHALTLLANGWGARIEAQTKDEPVFAVWTSTTATTSATVQLVDRTGAAIDCSFWIEIFGVLS